MRRILQWCCAGVPPKSAYRCKWRVRTRTDLALTPEELHGLMDGLVAKRWAERAELDGSGGDATVTGKHILLTGPYADLRSMRAAMDRHQHWLDSGYFRTLTLPPLPPDVLEATKNPTL
jgi:hypothetical protein